MKNCSLPSEIRGSAASGGRAAGALLALLLLAAGAAACSKSQNNSKPDGGDVRIDVIPDTVLPPGDMRVDTMETAPPCSAGDAPKAIGDACSCDAQCGSGHCADGVCCNVACTEGCKTCAMPGPTLGTCVNRAVGDPARDTTSCPVSPVSTCGLDGKCDGMGGCSKYAVNTMCKPGMCDGDAVVGSYACDGVGHCKPGSTKICVPFSCDPATNDCVETCTTNSECTSGQQCVSGSCGKKMKGASCKVNDDCASGFCADGVCCNVACQGACVSCNLTGREGTCWPIDADIPDPRKICHDMGMPSCGQTGLCDGFGGCSKYARDTVCVPATCSGNIRNTPGTCDGLGTCSAPGIQTCHPFRCTNGLCTTTCTTSADCDTGIACMNNSCGLKLDGQSCLQSSECANNHCVDGVCCDQACGGGCRSCALTSTLGHCTPIAAGTVDPRGVCAPMAQSTCGTNGKCDGQGGCQTWPVGTLCADETCNPTGNVYKAPSTCNASGQCVAPDLIACSPFICNATRCFIACTNDSQCVPPNTCINNSCGLKDNGASCSDQKECKSTFCAQGVCCDQACTGACKSCSVGQLGQCTDVTGGAIDPTGQCVPQDQSTCGLNGRCQAGACQKWAANTPCMPATCPTTTNLFTALSTCDGAGTCVVPGTTSCFPYRCGTAACKATCTADADCLPPATCANGLCGLKPPGAICASKAECLSGFCEQGVCCQTACTGICKSCALSASRGVCSNITAGTVDILSRCSDQGAASCGTDGYCDGNGACRLYSTSTVCAPAMCPTNTTNPTLTPSRNCNGLGVCQPATTIACAPYQCNGTTACLAACSTDSDCLSPNICDPPTSKCGNKKRLGQACTATSDCLTGNFCVDGVCCGTSSCSLCQACNVGTSAGRCTFVPTGSPDTMGRCTPNPPCGLTGMCNGAGACQMAAATVSCGSQSCSGSTFTPTSHCDGSGNCLPPTASSCSPYTCTGSSCRTTCAMDSHCVSPFTCQGSPPNRSCALKPNGMACTAGNQCISGSCVDGICCGLPAGSTSCGTCQTCNGTSPGTCTPFAAGTTAPAGQCTAAPPCGNTGTCNGSGGCTQAAASVSCGLALSCSGTTLQPASTCTGSGTCNQTASTTCGNYICGSTTACRTNCTSDTHCANTNLYCNGNTTTPGSCVAKKANGASCGGNNECGSGNCTDGTCCSTASCPTCQACSNSAGTCANVALNTADPHSRCPASPPCGNTGVCNGSGACQQQPSTLACGAAESCSGTTYQPPSHCSGTGTCSQTATMDCGAYKCGTTTCKTSCTTATETTDCAAGNFCFNGGCTAKRPNGGSCSADDYCVNGHCVDGTCCSTGSCPTCQACNNSAGTCANVALNTTDPHARCPNNGTCGNTGACNGSGACQQQPNTLGCGTAVSCSGNTYQPPSFCSGSGTCSQTGTMTCANHLVCNTGGTACLSSCNSDNDCIGGYFCNAPNGSCQLKGGAGAGCGSNHECTSNQCVDGVCCNFASCGTCQTCNGTSPGNCTALGQVTPEADPHGRCPANPPCGNNGTGLCVAGACQQVANGTMCSGFFCTTVSKFQPGGSCTGTGSCSVPPVQDCAPYTCATGGCRGTCTDDTMCVGAFYCNGNITTPGSCVPKKPNDGSTCGRDGECGTGHCAPQGVCCDSACTGQCQSCTGNNVGTCAGVPAHAFDPTGMCLIQPEATCGTDGRCTSGGACEVYDMSTVCGTSCSGTDLTTMFCDGTGMGGCTQSQTVTCPSMACADPTSCAP